MALFFTLLHFFCHLCLRIAKINLLVTGIGHIDPRQAFMDNHPLKLKNLFSVIKQVIQKLFQAVVTTTLFGAYVHVLNVEVCLVSSTVRCVKKGLEETVYMF